MSDQTAPPPQTVIMQMLTGMWVSQILSATAQLRVADLIAEGSTTLDALAAGSHANVNTLQRLLRAAATLGLITEPSPKTYALTPLGETLRTDVRGSLRDFVIAETAPGHWLPWGRLADVVREGRSFATEALGIAPWEYYAKNAEEGLSFARAMSNLSAMVAESVAAVYNVGDAKTIVDVGGSQGVLLRGLLQSAPNARGIIFDRPEVIANAKADDRIELAGGDFFESVPRGADMYVLKSILHDWPDDKCVEILKTIHRDAAPGARIVIVEMLVTDEPGPVNFMDLNMLVMLDGRERTGDEYSAMLREAGFETERIIATPGLYSVVEGRRL